MVCSHSLIGPYVLQGGGIGGVGPLDSHDISGLGKRARLLALFFCSKKKDSADFLRRVTV